MPHPDLTFTGAAFRAHCETADSWLRDRFAFVNRDLTDAEMAGIAAEARAAGLVVRDLAPAILDAQLSVA